MSDQKYLKKVLTHKSGQFVFSANFDQLEALKVLLPAEAVCRTLGDYPMLPQFFAQLDAELIRRSIFGTAAIEGNTLDEAQVGDILAGKTHAEPGEFELEISNLKKAYGRYADYPAQTEPLDLSEETIKDIHSLITQGLANKENIPGQYRNAEVKVGDVEHGGVYTPPKILADIKTLMAEFTDWINCAEIKALPAGIRAGLIRNQQVRGSSPRAGSRNIKALRSKERKAFAVFANVLRT